MAYLGILGSSSSFSSCSVHGVKREEEEEEEKKQKSPSSFSSVIHGDGIGQQEELNLPLGYRFHPTDSELLVNYLVNKILGLKLPADIVKDIDLYQYDPHELPIREFKHGKKNEAYFFTQTEQKYTHGMQQKRTTPTGYWKATGGDVEIFYREKIVIGFKKILVFYQGKAPRGKRTAWIMHEYRVIPRLIPVHKMNGCVACWIRYKGTGDMPSREANKVASPAESSEQIHKMKRNMDFTQKVSLQIQQENE